MANITASVFAASLQADGRSIVHEVHTDSQGLTHDIVYNADQGADLNAALAAHAAALGTSLGTDEISSNLTQVFGLGSLAVPTFHFSIVADNVAALRAAYAVATQVQAIMTGDFLNSLTAAQLQNAFGLTAGQVNTLRTNKLGPAATLAASIRAAAGQ